MRGLLAVAVAAGVLAGCLPSAPVSSPESSAVSEVTGVFWVPECANGPLVLDGTTWYPVDPVSREELKEDPPTPGSGQGSFTLFSDGRAYWISGGGLYGTWLSTEPQEGGKGC